VSEADDGIDNTDALDQGDERVCDKTRLSDLERVQLHPEINYSRRRAMRNELRT
jgi:hypothetical protein